MAPENEPPKIPSFKPLGKSEEEKKGGGMPAMGKTPSAPSAMGTGFKFPGVASGPGGGGLKVRGLPGGATVVERLKRLRKKDLAFIAAGLSVLMMAPVAEHFLMSPEQESGVLQQGFSTPGDNSLFPDGRTIYEGGTGGLSPGALYGQGSDVITPLNVRDPAALVMGPGATQKPAATVTAPETPTAQPAGGGWKDALAQAASAGTKSAVQKTPKLPMPNVKMSGALRGLGAASGGGGGSLSLAPLSASNVPNKAKDSNSLSRVAATPGYRGASRSSKESGGGMESLKSAADRQGDIFNKGRSAAGSLDTAAREAIPGGGGSGSSEGNPSQGDAYKYPGGNQDGDKRNISIGESLDLMRQKLEMQKAIDLKWKKKEWNEFGRKQMIEKMFIESGFEMFKKALIEPVSKSIGDAITTAMNPAGGPEMVYKCTTTGEGIKKSDVTRVLGSTIYFKEGSKDCPGGSWWLTSGSASEGGPAPGDQKPPDASPETVSNIGGSNGVTSGAQVTGQTWKGDVDGLRTRTSALKAKIEGVSISDDKLKALQDIGLKGLGKVEGAVGNHQTSLAKYEAAVVSMQRANEQMVPIQRATADMVKVEQEVVADSGKALEVFKAKLVGTGGSDFGLAEAKPYVESMLTKAKTVDGFKTKESEITAVQSNITAAEQQKTDADAALVSAEGVVSSLEGDITSANTAFRALPQQMQSNDLLAVDSTLIVARTDLDRTNGTGRGSVNAMGVAYTSAKGALGWTRDAHDAALTGVTEVTLNGKKGPVRGGQFLTGTKGNESTAYRTDDLYRMVQSLSTIPEPERKEALARAQQMLTVAQEAHAAASKGMETVAEVHRTAVETLEGKPGTRRGR